MLFSAAIVTPKNTSKQAPIETPIPIVFGTITRVAVWFPPGVNNLAHLKLLWGLTQLFPSNEQGDITGGGVLIDWPEGMVIDTQPQSLTAVTWNTDTVFDHEIDVYIALTPLAGTVNASDVANQLLAAQQTNQGESQ